MSSLCKYCGRVEIVFDNAFKSKSGKMIPLDKTSGVPHQCSESPYAQQQQQQQQGQQQHEGEETDSGNTNALLRLILAELERLVKLFEDQRKQEQQQEVK